MHVESGRDSYLALAIEKATNKESDTVNQTALRTIKALCKVDPGQSAAAADLLIERFRDGHAQVRIHALYVTEVLFSRSKPFRTAFAGHFTVFLEQAVGIRANKPLPGPQPLADKLREQALEAVEQWNEKWGSLYHQVRVGYVYLSRVLKVQFPGLRHRTAVAEAEARAVEAREQEALQIKFNHIQGEFNGAVEEMSSTLLQLDTSFSLLHSAESEEEEEWEEAGPSPADPDDAMEDGVGLASYRSEKAPVEEGTADTLSTPAVNQSVLETLGGLQILVVNKHLPLLEEWLRVAIKVSAGTVATSAEPTRDTILRVAIQLRRRLQEAQRRLAELPPSLKARRPIPDDPSSKSARVAEIDALFASDSDEDVMCTAERGPGRGASTSAAAELPGPSTQGMQEGGNPLRGSLPGQGDGVIGKGGRHSVEDASGGAGNSGRPGASVGNEGETVRPVYRDPAAFKPRAGPALQLSATARLGMATAPDPKKVAPAAKVEAPKELPETLKKKLLEQAPKVDHGVHLLYWDSEMESMLVNNRNMEVQNHWGPVDASAQLPAERIAEFFGRKASYYVPPSKQAAVSVASAAPPKVEAAPQELAGPSLIQPPRPAPKVTSMAATDLLTRKLLPTGSRDAGASSLAAPRAKLPSGTRPLHREREGRKATYEASGAQDKATSSSLPKAALRPDLPHQPPEAHGAAGSRAVRSGAVSSTRQVPAEASGGERERAGEANREGGFCPPGSGSVGRGGVTNLSRHNVEEARPPDVRTQAQRDRDFNRAVLAAAEKQSVSAFAHLDLPTPQDASAAPTAVPAGSKKRKGSVKDRLGKKLHWGR